LLRVPEVVRDHVYQEAAKVTPEPSDDIQSDVNAGIASSPEMTTRDTDWLKEPAPPKAPVVEIDRTADAARKTGARRA
jgi:hypothetical protein